MGLGTASAQTANACLAAMGDGSSWSPRTGSATHWKNSPTGLTCCLDAERNDKAEMTRHRKSEDCLIQKLQKISDSRAYAHSEQKDLRLKRLCVLRAKNDDEKARISTPMQLQCDLFLLTRISVLEYHMQKMQVQQKDAKLKSGIKVAKLKSGKKTQ